MAHPLPEDIPFTVHNGPHGPTGVWLAVSDVDEQFNQLTTDVNWLNSSPGGALNLCFSDLRI